jgi:hypothetical protein
MRRRCLAVVFEPLLEGQMGQKEFSMVEMRAEPWIRLAIIPPTPECNQQPINRTRSSGLVPHPTLILSRARDAICLLGVRSSDRQNSASNVIDVALHVMQVH